jgi:hypothetical protein
VKADSHENQPPARIVSTRRIIMRNVKRIVLLLIAVLLVVGELKAHDITWWGNPWPGLTPNVPMIVYVPNGQLGNQIIGVVPEDYETCTVVVENVTVSDPTLISAVILAPNPANAVQILVLSRRSPKNHLETATVTADWYATGLPADGGCTSVTPTTFTVPIQVSDQEPKGLISLVNPTWININMGRYVALQSSDCLTGPWEILGLGQMFSVYNDMRMGTRFYQGSTMPGGTVDIYFTDPFGNPFPGLFVGLDNGGASATSDSTGYANLPWLPQGPNVLLVSNLILSSLHFVLPHTNNTAVNFVVAMAAVTNAATNVVTNVCNCTPWCAIGYGTLASGQTPVYYSGGANQPPGGSSTCGTPTVTVTPPSGPAFTIHPGTRGHQSSGPNPASGTWTVTAVVCGLTKTASVDVP